MTNRIAGTQIVLISALVLMAAKVTAGPLPQATAAGRTATAPTPTPTPTPTPPQKREGHAGPAASAAPVLAAPATSASSSAAISNTPHPIASMTADERMRLPDTTMVIVKSGRTTRTASLGALRAEHRARLERFTRAAALGQMAASKLAMQSASSAQPAGSTQPNPAATTKARSATGPAQRSGLGNPGVVQPDFGVQMRPGAFLPLQLPKAKGTIPKDYVDFCRAANASACIYLPAYASLTEPGLELPLTWVEDYDSLITDKNVCAYDGGFYDGYACAFYYPIDHAINFKPTGPVLASVSCDPPSKHYLDPKGAARVSYSFNGGTLYSGTPITCVVRVSIGF